MNRGTVASHILPSSATMIGVCLTSISLIKLLEGHNSTSHVDEYLALDSILFLASAMFSYLSLRASGARVVSALEGAADRLFIVGLITMAFVATLFAYEIV